MVSRRRKTREIEKALVLFGRDTKGKKMAARKLGIGLATLYRKLLYKYSKKEN